MYLMAALACLWLVCLTIGKGPSTACTRVAIDVMNGLDQVPVAYVLNIEDVQQRRFIIAGGTSGARYDQSQRTIPGTAKQAWWICHGNFSSVYSVLDSDPVVRIGGYLNHIISLLNG